MNQAASAAEAWRSKQGTSVHPGDADKVRYVLKNLVRDWSTEGASEREESYGLIIRALTSIFHDRIRGEVGRPTKIGSSEGDAFILPRVLVPGCGLARLCVELARCGFEAVGNEFSYFMLLTANLILNHTGRSEQVRFQ